MSQVYQQTIDFNRASKLRLLEQVVLPARSGSRTSQAAMKAVLRVIDSHARDQATARLKLATIAAEAGHAARSTTVRAIAELRRLCVLDVTSERRSGKRASQYQIIWSNLRDTVDQVVQPASEQSETVQSDGARDAERWRTEQEAMAHHAPSDGAPCAIRWRTMRHLVKRLS